ncbi:TetR/AcrR family transcriptional regulator C-terminal domain-containing protein [Arthrobacter sp. L77]|uniref:TetR/AcrR family transcriptional regulator C-terminal domain-containing protein n=1 Tax=Arthrobacter sp. L77 TaxID=1496689 RepID=UPI000AD901AD|nr:TetR/AcrR family transcriptional regulator C-terminal domain-containing protein [Arthrobacter sp. L77]
MRLSRAAVLTAAVALADGQGVGGLNMRTLAEDLGVVPMALYKHVSSKEDLLDGMVDVIVAEIDPPLEGQEWRTTVRSRVLSARAVLQRHRWARQVLETRTTRTPAVLAYTDSFIGMFLDRGFSVDLTHHVMHALGSRMWGFTQELFDARETPAGDAAVDSASAGSAPPDAAQLEAMARRFPNVLRIARAAAHDDDGVVGRGCDDQYEFEFALDLLLDGIEGLHARGWTSART